jgi:hypothetical protein
MKTTCWIGARRRSVNRASACLLAALSVAGSGNFHAAFVAPATEDGRPAMATETVGVAGGGRFAGSGGPFVRPETLPAPAAANPAPPEALGPLPQQAGEAGRASPTPAFGTLPIFGPSAYPGPLPVPTLTGPPTPQQKGMPT